MSAENMVSLTGIFVIIALAWGCSSHRKAFPVKTVVWGLVLQIIFALVVLVSEPGRQFFSYLNELVNGLLAFSTEGAKFVFNGLAESPAPDGSNLGVGFGKSLGFFFAFQVLTTIVFFSSLMSVLYYLGIMQKIVLIFAKIMAKTMGTSGAESLSASANIFVGQTEAPLVIRPYVGSMTMSELMAVMTGGFATVAGGVMAAYVGMLNTRFPNIAGHLISASVLSAPAALVLAKVIMPETEEPKTRGEVKMHLEIKDANVLDAACNGATVGLQLALNVAAMLMAIVALLAMVNAGLGWVGIKIGYPELTLQLILGWAHYPLTVAMGVPMQDAMEISKLFGEKLILTEFIAYMHLGDLLNNPNVSLDPRSVVIATYGLCGFANFASIAIQIGGIAGIAPERRSDLAKLGLRAMMAGALAAYMTATVAGAFYTGETLLSPTSSAPEVEVAIEEADSGNQLPQESTIQAGDQAANIEDDSPPQD